MNKQYDDKNIEISLEIKHDYNTPPWSKDYVTARKFLADLINGTVNDTTNKLSKKIIFGSDEERKAAAKEYVNIQKAKYDDGKLQISLVPTQIIEDIAEVRMYGNKKYGDPNNWKTVEKQRYIDALLRHTIAYLNNPDGVDDESGISHYKHMACNMAFICEMEKAKQDAYYRITHGPLMVNPANMYPGYKEDIENNCITEKDIDEDFCEKLADAIMDFYCKANDCTESSENLLSIAKEKLFGGNKL